MLIFYHFFDRKRSILVRAGAPKPEQLKTESAVLKRILLFLCFCLCFVFLLLLFVYFSLLVLLLCFDFAILGAFLVLLGAFWVLLGAFWVPLGLSWALLGRSWGALGRSWGGLGAQVDFWSIFCPILAPTWLPKGAHKATKTEPKTNQNRRQILTSKKQLFKTGLVPPWGDLGSFLVAPGGQKY